MQAIFAFSNRFRLKKMLPFGSKWFRFIEMLLRQTSELVVGACRQFVDDDVDQSEYAKADRGNDDKEPWT